MPRICSVLFEDAALCSPFVFEAYGQVCVAPCVLRRLCEERCCSFEAGTQSVGQEYVRKLTPFSVRVCHLISSATTHRHNEVKSIVSNVGTALNMSVAW